MIDIHSHIIPGVDDGSQNMDTTISMLKMAYEQGVKTMFGTPHYSIQKGNHKIELQDKAELVKEESYKINHDFQIYLGSEIYYEEGSLEAVKKEWAFTMAGSRYVLIEFFMGESYERMYKGMKDFILEGYIPIIAHIERYQCLWKKRERIRELIELGCYIQMNTESLIGGNLFGFLHTELSYCRKLVQSGLIHFIASDSHNLESRKPNMGDCVKSLEKVLDKDLLNRITYENPLKIIENKYI